MVRLLLIFLLISSCKVFDGNKWAVSTVVSSKKDLSSSISNVEINSNQFRISGSGLSGVTEVKLTGNGLDEVLTVNSAGESEIVASTNSAFSVLVNGSFNLIIGTAEAQASYPVTFTLQNGVVTASKLHNMGASSGQVLKFNGTNWAPANLQDATIYVGTWDANTTIPDVSTSNAGDYYIVSAAHGSYSVGDWIISDGYSWSRVPYSKTSVASFQGRKGNVVLQPSDYVSLKDGTSHKITGSSLGDLADIYLATTPTDGQVLTWDGTNSRWYANSVTGAGGAITLSSLSASSPLSYNSSTGAFSIQAATTSQAGSLSSTDKTKLDSLEAFPIGNGLVERFSSTLLMKSCSSGQFLIWLSPTGWTCTTTLSMSGDSAQSVSMARNSNAGIAGTALTLQAGGAYSGGSNLGGGNLVLSSGTSTGTGTSSINFQTSTAGSSGVADNTPTTKMTILGNGNVGIGTTTPRTKLDIPGGWASTLLSGDNVAIRKPNYTGGWARNLMQFEEYDSTVLTTMGAYGTNNTFTYGYIGPGYSNPTIVWTPSGNVGIGTTAPSYPLDVAGSIKATGTNSILLDSSVGAIFSSNGLWNLSTGNNSQVLTQTTGTSIKRNIGDANPSLIVNQNHASSTGDILQLQAGGASKVVVSQVGNVGIGTITPGSLLDLSSNGGRMRITQNTSGSIFNGIDFYGYSGGNAGGINFNQSSGEIRYTTGVNYFPTFYSNNSEAMRISTTGNVGIGTTTPSGLLDVNGNNSSYKQAVFRNSNGQQLWLGSVATTVGTYIGGNAYYNSSYQFIPTYTAASGINFRQDGSTEFWNDTGLTSGTSYLPSKRVVILNSGNVGVGTVSPAYTLDVNGTLNTSGNLTVGGVLTMTTASASTMYAGKFTRSSGINYLNPDIFGNSSGLVIGGLVGGTGSIALNTTGTTTPSMYLQQTTGNVGIGTTSPADALTVIGSASATKGFITSETSYGGTMFYGHQVGSSYANVNGIFKAVTDNTTGASNYYYQGLTGATTNYSVRADGLGYFAGGIGIGITSPSEKLHVSGNILATGTVTGSSDKRLKKNIMPITGALEKIRKLVGVTFDWIKPKEHSDGKQLGVIAQEIEKVFPEAVRTEKDGFKSVAYMSLIAPVIEAVKEFYEKWIVDSKVLHREITSLREENLLMKKELCKVEKNKYAFCKF